MDKKAQGKANRKAGAAFELAFRKKYEKMGWIVTKFQSNIDLEAGKVVMAKSKYIPGRGLMPGLGFPDFVMFKRRAEHYTLAFVECKTNNKLTKIEKQKLDWLTKEGHKCYVAYKDEKEIKVRKFVEYKERDRVCPESTGD